MRNDLYGKDNSDINNTVSESAEINNYDDNLYTEYL